MKNHPEHVIPLLPAMERIFPKLQGLLAIWLFSGAGWGNIGLVKAAEALGEDAGPIIATMKALLPDLLTRPKTDMRRVKEFQKVQESVKKAIETHEKKYGVVKPE